MPPSTRRQQKFMYAEANRGASWAQKWIKEGKTKVTPTKSAQKAVERKYKRGVSAYK